MKTSKLQLSQKKGYIALITAIIIGAVTLSMVITSAYIGITQGANSLLFSNNLETVNLASACAEEALMKIKNDPNYGGNETINLENGQCQILPIINIGGQSRIIETTGTINAVTKKIKIQVSQIDPTMQIILWQEVADF